MKKWTFAAIAVAAATIWFPACGADNELTDVEVCTGISRDRCPEAMKEIPADTPMIYTAGRLQHAVEDTRVTAALINQEGEEPLELATTTITVEEVTSTGEAFPVFYFTSTEPWTRGSYRVEMKVEAAESDPVVVEFEVR